jgi:hypothetical protein
LKLRQLAVKFNCHLHPDLEIIIRDLSLGANIGCSGIARLPTISTNAPSAFEYAAEVTDAIADWVTQGFAAGPFDPSNRPKTAKVSGIMCRPKPNGTARVILNFSAPEGLGVNDGIDNEDFPTSMSSTSEWLKVLDTCGKRALMLKIDWAAAYKHIHVRTEDLPLQYFNWLGKDFIELMLVFGARSSAGIYDRLAKFVLLLTLAYSRFPRRLVCQYLDDICAASAAGSDNLATFETAYRAVAAELGIQLAPTSDPDKAFSPRTDGVVLGIHYDTVNWTWRIPQDKLARILNAIRTALTADTLPMHQIWSLVGKLLHYAPLVPAAKFNIGHLVKATSLSTLRNFTVPLTADMKRQLNFWWVLLKTTDRRCTIPPPVRPSPPWAMTFYTDAAGGSSLSIGHGTGGVGPRFYFMVPWGRKINSGMRGADGKQFSKKMSALELVGPLICVSAGYDICRGRPVCIWVDNMGSVTIWKKGYSSTCGLSTTLVAAIGRVAAALGSTVDIQKITRRSDDGPILADELSKGKFNRFLNRLPENFVLPPEPAWIPPSILAWIADPQSSPDLGDKILSDLKQRTVLL